MVTGFADDRIAAPDTDAFSAFARVDITGSDFSGRVTEKDCLNCSILDGIAGPDTFVLWTRTADESASDVDPAGFPGETGMPG